MKKLLLITLALILAACSAGESETEIERNQTNWQKANINHYRFELTISCFCAFNEQMPLTVEVLDGQIVAMTAVDGTLVLDTDPNYAYFAEYATVENLFAKTTAALNSDAEVVNVKYDATHGFPTEIFIDQSQQMADEELYLFAANLEVLP